jgi:hypothetical protein
MKNRTVKLSLIAVAALFGIVASCAQMKTIPGLPASHPEALAVGQQVNCAECHEDQQKGTMKAFKSFNHTQSFVKNHRFYAASDDRLCSTCHQSSFCNDCHTNQVEMKPSTKYGNRPDHAQDRRQTRPGQLLPLPRQSK